MSDLKDEISLLIIGSIEMEGDDAIFIPISLAEQIASKCCDVAIKAVNLEASASLTKYSGHAKTGYIEKAEMGAFSRSVSVIKEAFEQ
jgi:hypothetical protein